MEESDDDLPPPTLVSDSQLDLREAREVQAYNLLRHQAFNHTRAFDMDLLARIGMDVEFDEIWHAVGWKAFPPVYENGSRLLTIQ